MNGIMEAVYIATASDNQSHTIEAALRATIGNTTTAAY